MDGKNEQCFILSKHVRAGLPLHNTPSRYIQQILTLAQTVLENEDSGTPSLQLKNDLLRITLEDRGVGHYELLKMHVTAHEISCSHRLARTPGGQLRFVTRATIKYEVFAPGKDLPRGLGGLDLCPHIHYQPTDESSFAGDMEIRYKLRAVKNMFELQYPQPPPVVEFTCHECHLDFRFIRGVPLVELQVYSDTLCEVQLRSSANDREWDPLMRAPGTTMRLFEEAPSHYTGLREKMKEEKEEEQKEETAAPNQPVSSPSPSSSSAEEEEARPLTTNTSHWDQ